MDVYIGLLRGINVGGKNKISMMQLKDAFSTAGFGDVQTYINSGNVLFSSDKDTAEVQSKCEIIIEKTIGFQIGLVVISSEELAEALTHAPDWWGKDPSSKHDAIFIIPPATAETVFAEVGEIKPEYEKVAYYGKLIFWSAPIKTFSRTRWSKVSKIKIYDSITVRNFKTAVKLSQLATELSATAGLARTVSKLDY